MTIRSGVPASEPARARRFLNAGLALLGFVLVAAVLNATLPFPEIGVVASHLRFFKKHRDEYDTLFIGSSLTHYQISPARFDRIMGERGHPTRSFNFGVNGMLVAESSFVLERILAANPKRLKWIFLEFDELDTRPFAGAEGSRRDVYWRDWKRTSLLVQKLVAGDETESRAFEAESAVRPELAGRDGGMRKLLWFHLRLFLKNIGNVSRRVDLAWRASHLWRPDKMPVDLGPDGDGYKPFRQEMSDERKALYQERLERERSNKGPRFVSASTERAYRQMVDAIRKAGATPVLVAMPVVSQVQLGLRPESGITGSILSFNDEQKYPELYRAEMRAEEVHLNYRGAEKFSTLLAERFSRLLDEQQAR